MRALEEMITIKVSLAVKKQLELDKKVFEKSIGGGKWSINDTIKQYQKKH